VESVWNRGKDNKVECLPCAAEVLSDCGFECVDYCGHFGWFCMQVSWLRYTDILGMK
jgi:hypothetical protein